MEKTSSRKKIYRVLPKILLWFFLVILIVASNDTMTGTNIIFSKSLEGYINFLMILSMIFVFVLDELRLSKNRQKSDSLLYKSHSYKLLKITGFIFSEEIQNEVFSPTMSDWQDEYFEALLKKDIWKARWINVRYTYAFLAAMWQKSPIGDLIEFVIKIAKP